MGTSLSRRLLRGVALGAAASCSGQVVRRIRVRRFPEGAERGGLRGAVPVSRLGRLLSRAQYLRLSCVRYLSSWEQMGSANLTCAGACQCAETTIDGHRDSPHKLSVTATKFASLKWHHDAAAAPGALVGAATGSCEVTLRVLEMTKSRGHKFKLLGVMHMKHLSGKVGWAFEQAMNMGGASSDFKV